jgi:putative colanic acid biosynthesis UDP-glucose lipid carrier transferase
MLYLNKSKFDIVVPLSYLIDFTIINLFIYFYKGNLGEALLFHAYITIAWAIISYNVEFYEIDRHTKIVQILNKIIYQFLFFLLILYAFIGFFKQPGMSRLELGKYFLFVALAISATKLATYFLLKNYRRKLRGNLKNVIVVGVDKPSIQLINIFNNYSWFGYKLLKQFAVRDGFVEDKDCFDFILNNDVEEIYCSANELSNEELANFVHFADNNLRTLKFIPDNKLIFSKKLKFEYYDYLPILCLRNIPLHNRFNAFLKRVFDIVFSTLTIVFLLSWLIPIIALIIRLESKGPVFFRQKRTGINNREFYCYKFRSMYPNDDSDQKWASKNDSRITRVGKFIRRTSIDELPQFYNVFFGTMSVVGPRPHPLKLTDDLSKKIDKFMVRHFIKPGITGLAQVRGERGEIEKDLDGINRLRFDIFYVENWSLFLDVKIIIQTALNIFKGQEKAY